MRYAWKQYDMEIKLIIAAAIVVAITILYKILPFRSAGSTKPFVAFLPKYKKVLDIALPDDVIEEKLSIHGFKRIGDSNGVMTFSRGSVIGDISIKLAKVKIGVKNLSNAKLEVTIQAGWVAAFDTGDHWKFIMELCKQLENA